MNIKSWHQGSGMRTDECRARIGLSRFIQHCLEEL